MSIEPKQKYIAYYRVSTDKQGERGLGMESQKKMVIDYVNSVNGELVNTYLEVVSGKRNDRKGILAALAECKKTGYILAVAKLDRLSRDVLFMAQLVKSKIKFIAVESPHIDKNFIHMRAVFSEMETDFISTRTKAALAILKSRGVKLGSPKLEILNAYLKDKANKFLLQIMPVVLELKDKQYSQRKIAKELTRRKIKTPRGLDIWHQKQVYRMLQSLSKQPILSKSLEMST